MSVRHNVRLSMLVLFALLSVWTPAAATAPVSRPGAVRATAHRLTDRTRLAAPPSFPAPARIGAPTAISFTTTVTPSMTAVVSGDRLPVVATLYNKSTEAFASGVRHGSIDFPVIMLQWGRIRPAREESMSAEATLKTLGYDIAPAALGQGKIEPAVRTGNLVYTSGQLPERDGTFYTGKVGGDLTLEQGYAAARLCALNCLSAIKAVVGDLDRITRVVKIFGMVNAAEGFTDTPQVIHGCTDLINEAFGAAGRHARSAVGLYQLPRNAAVEIEMIVEVRD